MRKVWRQLNREGIGAAKCTVARLMAVMGLAGAVRGKPVKTTISNPATPCPADRVNRQFHAQRPNALWLSDFTYVATWAGYVYVAFVIDAFARRIVGWRVSRSMQAGFVLDALEQALHARRPAQGNGLIHHSDRGSQGEFNRSSQHSDTGGCDDEEDTAFGSVWPQQVAFAGSSRRGAAWGAYSVLGRDRGRSFERGCRTRCWCIPSGRHEMVPEVRRHATITSIAIGQAAIRALPVF